MSWEPTEKELRRWWEAEHKFDQSRHGRMFNMLKAELMQLEHERDHYKRIVMDWARLQPDPAVIREALKPRVTLDPASDSEAS